MIKIAVIGPIGIGKTSFINTFSKQFLNYQDTMGIINFEEPAINNQDINTILKKFYKDNVKWAYPLEVNIAAAFEAIFTEIKEIEEDKEKYNNIIIVDTPFSPFIFSSIFEKNGRLTAKEKEIILSITKPFDFDYLFILKETAETIISRIKKRNRDFEISDEHKAYTEEHIRDYEFFLNDYLNRYFLHAKHIILKDMADAGTKEYEEEVLKIVKSLF